MSNSRDLRCRTCLLSTTDTNHDQYHQQILQDRKMRRRIDTAAEKLATAIADRFGTAGLRLHAAQALEKAIEDLGLQEPLQPRTMRRKPIGNGKRRAVWDRDEWTCQHCGTRTDLTVDHILPVIAGGSDDLENLQTLCSSCNASKGARL